MRYTDKIELHKELSEIYKTMMKQLYLKWSGKYTSTEIREEVTFWIMTHNHQKNMELVNSRKRRKLKVKKIQNAYDMLKAKEEQQKFVDSLNTPVKTVDMSANDELFKI